MPDLEALRAVEARLAAGETGKEVDRHIALAFGWTKECREPRFGTRKRTYWLSPGDGEDSLHGTDLHRDPPSWVTSLDAAMSIVPDGWSAALNIVGQECWGRIYSADERNPACRQFIGCNEHRNPAAALTLAIVRAYIALLENADAA